MADAVNVELEDLRCKLGAREGLPGFAENVAAIKARIAEIEAEEAAAAVAPAPEPEPEPEQEPPVGE